MNKGLTKFLQAVLVLIGIGVLFLLLWEPQLEGRNINKAFLDVYFDDAFLVYVYVASIAFFVGLYQAFKLLGYIGENKTYSLDSVKALRRIKNCAILLVAFIAGAEAYIFIAVRGKDDSAGGVAIGLFLMLVFVVVATTARMFEKTLQNTQLKSNN